MSDLACSLAGAINSVEARHVLESFGVREIRFVDDCWDGITGVSMYVVVRPDRFATLTSAESFRYPVWLIGLYAEIDCLVSRVLQAYDALPIPSEPLGMARIWLADGGRSIRGDEVALSFVRQLLAAASGLDEAEVPICLTEQGQRLRPSGRLALAGAPGQVLDRPVAAAAGWLMRIVNTGPWDGQNTPAEHWFQLTVIPDSPPETEIIATALRVTRHGYNFWINTTQELTQELAEVQAHLSSPPTASVQIAA